MSGYLLIESQDPFEYKDTEQFCQLALDLKEQGKNVVVYLVENGVFPARKCSFSAGVEKLMKANVSVYADKFSLQERGITEDTTLTGLKISSPDEIIDLLLSGYKTLWH